MQLFESQSNLLSNIVTALNINLPDYMSAIVSRADLDTILISNLKSTNNRAAKLEAQGCKSPNQRSYVYFTLNNSCGWRMKLTNLHDSTISELQGICSANLGMNDCKENILKRITDSLDSNKGHIRSLDGLDPYCKIFLGATTHPDLKKWVKQMCITTSLTQYQPVSFRPTHGPMITRMYLDDPDFYLGMHLITSKIFLGKFNELVSHEIDSPEKCWAVLNKIKRLTEKFELINRLKSSTLPFPSFGWTNHVI